MLSFPSHLIQARELGTHTGNNGWRVIESGAIWTNAQLTRIMDRMRTNFPAYDFRAVPNTPSQDAATAPSTQDAQAAELLLKEVVRLEGPEKALNVLAPIAAGEGIPPQPISPGLKLAQTPVDAISGVTPLPFREGDFIRDPNTGWVLQVVKVFPPDGTGKAFVWQCPEHPTEKTGRVPYDAVGNFEKYDCTPQQAKKENDALFVEKMGRKSRKTK